MVYRGRVKGGVVVPDPPADLPEGAQVNIEVLVNTGGGVANPLQPKIDGPFAGLLSLAGAVKNLPSDAARNYKHYLYGVPKED